MSENSNCILRRDPCIGDNDHPICRACKANTSSPFFDYSIVSPEANLERILRRIKEGSP